MIQLHLNSCYVRPNACFSQDLVELNKFLFQIVSLIYNLLQIIQHFKCSRDLWFTKKKKTFLWNRYQYISWEKSKWKSKNDSKKNVEIFPPSPSIIKRVTLHFSSILEHIPYFYLSSDLLKITGKIRKDNQYEDHILLRLEREPNFYARPVALMAHFLTILSNTIEICPKMQLKLTLRSSHLLYGSGFFCLVF